ncbi:hypothetical protein [Dermatobacter hominis]|uniref:hypothetical protein n=1 Tax=Dermatobacter hominis TaxID=2884263 RepID=UPI001D0F8886|nr:hypothetical protein [Dermatobacter hominis]UDY35528.1 hypothetical protein LH044_19630 [Dermatobacter hominis]
MQYTPEDLRARVEPFLDVLRDGVEEGWSHVPKVQKLLRVDPNPWSDADVVRRVARDRLLRAIADESNVGWTMDETVPNSGIHLLTPDSTVRVARGTIDRVPCPGKSKAKAAFYAQDDLFAQLSFEDLDLGFETRQMLNLLVLWSVDDFDAATFTIAVPKGPWRYGAQPRLLASLTISPDEPTGRFETEDDDGRDLVARVDREAEADPEPGAAG